MEKSNELKTRDLQLAHFEQYPLWTWDESMEYQVPVLENEPSVHDYHDFFIRATFQTNGYVFGGYLVGSRYYHAFGIFIRDKDYMFNISMRSLNAPELQKVFTALQCAPFKFFPVHYESSVKIKELGPIRGELDFPA